jgi:hypothetical protein
VVTVTCTVPDPGGAMAVICVGEFTVKVVATVPNFTVVTIGTNPVPVIVTLVFPEAGPDVGEREVMVVMSMFLRESIRAPVRH